MHLGGQQIMAQVLRALPPMWEVQMELWAPGLNWPSLPGRAIWGELDGTVGSCSELAQPDC